MFLIDPSILTENVNLKNKGKDDVSIRVRQNVGDTAKNHFNFKMFAKRSDDSVEIKLDKNTLAIDFDATKSGIKGPDNKKLYRDHIEDVAGAINYSEKEIREYLKKEKAKDPTISENDIQKKFDEFGKLSKSEAKKYINVAKSISESAALGVIDFE